MSFYTSEQTGELNVGAVVFTVFAFVVIVVAYVSLVNPQVRVYSQELRGKAALREAEWSSKVAIETARAFNESATLQAEARIKQETANAQAEVIRAQGVADANAIIADGLKDNEAYLRYLWIDKISTANTFYIPTEANLPILEAGKRN